jgi:hypothetical protein
MRVWLPARSYKKHERGRTEGDLTGAWPATMERRRACRRSSNLPVMSWRKDAAAAASSTEVSGVAERRYRQRAGRRRRRCCSSVLRSGGEAPEAEEQRRKTMAWGKKRSLPPPPYLYACQVRVVGRVVLHSPDRFCGEAPRGGTEWGGGYCNRAMTQ